MRLRSRRSPVLLLLLPALASALSVPQDAKDTVLDAVAPRDVAVPKKDYTAILPTSLKPGPTVRPDVGTKDAPVDGLDGKPHAGPFVDTTPDAKKPAAGGDDLPTLKKALPTSLAKLKSSYSSEEGWDLIPEKNDGVMDDENRLAPKKGTTGTEGGVSEKEANRKLQEHRTGEKLEKTPDPPKEAPPLPHDEEQERLAVKEKKEKEVQDADEKKPTEKPKGAIGLEKPTDLPDKPHNIPHPEPNNPTIPDPDAGTASHPSPLQDTMPYTEGQKHTAATPLLEGEEPEGIIQPFHSFVLSITMILFSEIGDKTFLVAALMAMRHDRLVVFSAALSALIAMTVLSAILGHALPTLLPKRFTAFLAAILFLVFGAKMLREGLAMPKDSGVGEEMKEVEAELEEKEHQVRKLGSRRRSSLSAYALESGRGRGPSRTTAAANLPKPPQSPPDSDDSRSPSPSRRNNVASALNGMGNLFSLLLSPAWVQTFVMTFLGEWGDRSQIATIAMAAGQDYWWVTAGAISGHAVCTGIAVIGGRALAGRVSMRVVTIGGAVAFLVFGVIYLADCAYSD